MIWMRIIISLIKSIKKRFLRKSFPNVANEYYGENDSSKET